MTKEKPVAVVTGSATGVGRATVLRLAKMGFNVVINYSRSEAEAAAAEKEAQAEGANCLCIQCDVSNEAAVTRMFGQVEQQFGRLDVLVNNAAQTVFVPADDLQSLTEDKWDRLLAVNLKGPFFCIKAAAALLRNGDGGAIVNVSSVAALTGQGSSIAYAASKGALNTLTKSFARSLAPRVRVNAVLPGPIDTRWIREGANDWDLNEMTKDYPLPRASTPDDIADGIIYLATGTSMTTGQLLVIDGGKCM